MNSVITYNAAGERVKMEVNYDSDPVITRYYIGGRYEYDVTEDETTERLYIGRDAYSAPVVLQNVESGGWTFYNIGRDYLGSITHITTDVGNLVAEYSYNPWGRLRNPATLEIYQPGYEPDLLIGRGFTGHEHLPWFGLINMNARLYDPLLGRFLQPDPYIQDPDGTQNFNRYSYALNNPLRYTDESGEIVGTALLISIGVGAIINVAFNWKSIDNLGEGILVALSGAASGALAAVTGGSSIGVQIAAGLGTGLINSVSSNIVKQTGKSGSGIFDWGELGRSALSGAFTGAVTAGANNLINAGKVSSLLDKLKINNNSFRNIIGNAIEGGITGIVAGAANGIGMQISNNGLQNWSWGDISKSVLSGFVIGSGFGAINGLITEGIFQKQLDKGRGPFLNSDVAESLGERAGEVAANLEASSFKEFWPFGHNYANQTIELSGSICIGIKTGRCSINISPNAPMVPTVPTYYVPVL